MYSMSDHDQYQNNLDPQYITTQMYCNTLIRPCFYIFFNERQNIFPIQKIPFHQTVHFFFIKFFASFMFPRIVWDQRTGDQWTILLRQKSRETTNRMPLTSRGQEIKNVIQSRPPPLRGTKRKSTQYRTKFYFHTRVTSWKTILFCSFSLSLVLLTCQLESKLYVWTNLNKIRNIVY
jgi:hypothetical protein